MINNSHRLALSLGVTALLVVGLFMLCGMTARTAGADAGTLFVTPLGSGAACTQAQPCALQTALTQATDGDTLYLAGGTYTGAGDEVVKITHSIIVYGGWDAAPAGPVVRDPAAHVTTLDGQGQRRVVYISGDITPTLDGLTITGGNASSATADAGLGGGIFSLDASPVIQHNIVVSNSASITPTTFGNGGGIYLSYAPSSAIISGNLVLSNTAAVGASGHGGGIYLWQSDATVRGNLVQGNTCPRYGAGMYVSGGAPRLMDNEIRGNVAGRNAGGIYTTESSVLVQGNLIVGNVAGGNGLSWNGGGLLVVNGTSTITANRILNNAAGSSGGLGLEMVGYFTVTNNVIAHNGSEGIMLWEPPLRGLIAHNTIAYNGGMGGIYLAYGYVTPTIVNNIVVSNTYGIYAHADASGTLDHNDVWGNTAQDYGSPGALEPGPHDIQADPRLVNPAGDDYHLRFGSPCIDVGVDAGVTTDLDGDPRPLGAGTDIGADERRMYVYLPLVLKNYPRKLEAG